MNAASADPAHRLSAIRKEIDRVDQDLLALFNRRAALSLEVGRIKAHEPGIIFKPLREREVLDGLAAQNSGPLPEEHLRAIWREIFSSSRALQRAQNVAYLGPEGTFSYFAGVEYLGHAARFHPCGDIAQVFEEVSAGRCELGVVPLENSLQGTVGVSFDLFLKHEVFIQAELFSRISHCLLSNAPTLAAVRTVYSHPQPLAQCGGWLRAHLPNAGLVPVESTAAAANRAGRAQGRGGHRSRQTGRHARSRRAGPAHRGRARQLDALCDHRSQVRPKSRQPAAARKTPCPAIPARTRPPCCSPWPDKAGALSTVLDLLAGHEINMRKLESRPLRGQCWKYVFFADVESDLEDPRHAALLKRLREACTSFRILGSYPTGPQLDRMSVNEEESRHEQGV